MIPGIGIFNATEKVYMYLTNWGLKLLWTVIGAFIGAFFGAFLEARSRRKRDLFARLNDKIYEPWMAELEERYEFRLISFDKSLSKPKIGYTFYFGVIGGHKNYLVEEIEKIFRKRAWLIKHVKRDIKSEWEDFKKKFLDYEKDYTLFFEEIKETVSQRAELPFNKRYIRDKFIGPSFIEHIYNKIVLKVTGKEDPLHKESLWYEGIEPSIERSGDGIYELRWVEHPLGYSVYAKGSEEEMKKCKNTFKELINDSKYMTKSRKSDKTSKRN